MNNKLKQSWTKEQQEAIDMRGKNILVSAAAGSGKTAVLTERIVDLIDKDNVEISSMLIVTFTNAAAAEMKKRIQKKLQERISIYIEAGENIKQIEFLNKQIENVSSASISTVHAFCIKVLRENFTEINIDPGFKIIDDTYARSLKIKAVDEILEKEYEADEKHFFYLLDGYSDAKSDRKLKNTILEIERFTTAAAAPGVGEMIGQP